MIKSFLLGALALVLLKPFVVRADEAECIVKRDGNIPLHARKCKQDRKSYQVQTCDSSLICRAKAQNVESKPGACKNSPAGPKYMEFYLAENNEGILEYLKSQPNVYSIKYPSDSSKQVNPGQKVALIEFASKNAMAESGLSKNSLLAEDLIKKQFEYVYEVSAKTSHTLSAYTVKDNKLIRVPPHEAIPSCGDK